MDKPEIDTGDRKGRSNRAALCERDVSKATSDVVDWMLQGASGAQIMEAFAEKHPGVNVGSVLANAGNHFETIAGADTDLIKGWCFEATRDLYRRMLEIGDYANALRAVKQMKDFVK
jgi:hypothetical protein